MDSHEVSNSIFHINEAIPSIAPHVFARVGPFAITNTTTTVFFIALICAIVAIVLRKPKQKPGIFQNTIEYLYEVILGLVMQIIGDEKKAKQAVPYIAAILVYILISNLLPLVLGILPLTVLQGGEHITLLRGTTTDFNTTFALAVAIILILQIIAVKEQGFFGYLSHFIQIKQVVKGFQKGLSEGGYALVSFFVGLIEIISEAAKMLSLSLRLFGNMFAHEVLTVVLLGIFAIGLPSLWMSMGVLVGVVQSVVFAALVTVYYSLVLKKEEH